MSHLYDIFYSHGEIIYNFQVHFKISKRIFMPQIF